MTVLAIVFGLGVGLCGLSLVLPSGDQEFHTNWLSLPSVLMMVLSLLAMIVTLVAWAIAGTFGRFASKPQTLFGDSGKDSRDGEDVR